MITPGRYRHFKGGLYKVHAVAEHSETHELLAIYSKEGGTCWARPITMFEEDVIVDGEQKPRFERVEEEEGIR